MKLSSLTLTIVVSASTNVVSIFVSPSVKFSMRIAMSNEAEPITGSPATNSFEAEVLRIPSNPEIIMSQSLLFMERPPELTGILAGDVGFDPFGFSKTKNELMNYREAEVKHARLAMLVS